MGETFAQPEPHTHNSYKPHKGFPRGGTRTHMGYECPVCGIPQADSGHLANHIAFTALIHSDEHEDWLDETVPGWSDLSEDELADAVTAQSERVEFPQMFEDTTTGSEHQHDHERSGQLFDELAVTGGSRGRQQSVGDQPAALDAEAQSILNEARRMTEERLEDDEE
jgi:hypothetical protein